MSQIEKTDLRVVDNVLHQHSTLCYIAFNHFCMTVYFIKWNQEENRYKHITVTTITIIMNLMLILHWG